jgi:hypothetical protein
MGSLARLECGQRLYWLNRGASLEPARECRMLPYVAVCCRMLPYVAVCCRMLPCVAVCCRVLPYVAVCCRMLPCVAVCCRMLPCVAVCCRMLPYVVVYSEGRLLSAQLRNTEGVCVWGKLAVAVAVAVAVVLGDLLLIFDRAIPLEI